ncbi:MAG: polyribonucleotide nucleotidyltransferase [Deltaproteobacteria bacterium]|nr:polyribonucleotide nucleotidyltransferase [Deltaproteobacteria bacterium]
MPYWFEPKQVSLSIGGRNITIETGRMAKQSAGAAVVTLDNSVVLVTVNTAKPRAGIDFFPLTVDFVEKTSAAGKIPGGFFKREARLSDREILVCRFIDRSIRPLFAKGFRDEVQVTATVLAADGKNPPDMCAFYGASAALTLSGLPFNGPIGALRVAKIDGELVANPGYEEQERATLELMVAGSREALVMVEGGAREASEAELLEALQFGHREMQPLIEAQHQLAEQTGAPRPAAPPAPEAPGDLEAQVQALAGERMQEAVRITEKRARYEALRSIEDAALEELCTAYRNAPAELNSLAAVEQRQQGLRELVKNAKDALHALRSKLMRARILGEQVRIDGRSPRDIRSIFCEVRPLPRAHGVALFTRGETQALVYTTLGSSDDAQTIDALHARTQKHFLLHYNFPPFSVGEVRPLRGPSRRDIGHGNLAERALLPVIPDRESFPYTVRVVSEVLESNGSSSMATICGATLALMDAGVPLEAPVAGIAMGLIEEDGQRVVLSDILGDEDHLGDMDFKVAGTQRGITALQMDIKIPAIDWTVMEQALEQAREGRLHILECMARDSAEILPGFAARAQLSDWAPRMEVIRIKPDRIRDVIGPGGRVIRGIQEMSGAKVEVDDSGRVSIFAPDVEALNRAQAMVDELTQEAELEKLYTGKVRRITDFGAFVEIFPGTDGLVHISHLAEGRVERVADVVAEGDEILVKCIDIDPSGKIRLSRREALAEALAGAE